MLMQLHLQLDFNAYGIDLLVTLQMLNDCTERIYNTYS